MLAIGLLQRCSMLAIGLLQRCSMLAIGLLQRCSMLAIGLLQRCSMLASSKGWGKSDQTKPVPTILFRRFGVYQVSHSTRGKYLKRQGKGREILPYVHETEAFECRPPAPYAPKTW